MPKAQKDALTRAAAICGSQAELARAVDVTPATLWNWLHRDQVPAEYVLPICEATDNKVRPDQLRPDLYPAGLLSRG